MKSVLVTGGSGLVGHAIQNISHEFGNRYSFVFVSSAQCNLLEMNNVRNLFQEIKPYYVIHLAACVGGLFKNMNNKVKMLEENLMINYNVVKCCYDYKVEKLVACLSTCIFPDKTSYPIDETMLHDGPPHPSNEGYAYAKRMLEIHCRMYRENFGCNFVCVIPTNIYGLYDNFSLEDGHVIPSLIHKCYLAKQANEPFIVKGTGSPLRQFIFSEDLARLILWIVRDYNEPTIILSVPEDNEISIRDVATMIANEFQYDNIQFDTSFSDGQYKKTANNQKLMNYKHRIIFTPIHEGIRRTVDWFIHSYPG
jgi:GDP-L-fucose synthase